MTGRKRERKKSQYQFRLQLFLVCLESISSLHMKKLRLAAQAFWVLGLLVAHDNGAPWLATSSWPSALGQGEVKVNKGG